MYRVSINSLKRIMHTMLSKRQLSTEHIEYVANGLIEASLRGIDTHGARLFPTYISELDGGRSSANPTFKTEMASQAVMKLDADNALGLVAGMVATKAAIKIAKEQGVAAIAVQNSNHFGPASYYSQVMAREGLVGMSFSHSDALVAPFNGIKPLFGTNPLSVAVSGENDEIFCLDMATSQTSYSKIKNYRQMGMPLEEGWAVNNSGNSAYTSDDVVALKPLGNYKGQGLAMVVEILCSLLTGAPFDHELSHFYSQPFDQPRKVGHFFLALNIEAFQTLSLFQKRMSTLMAVTRQQEASLGNSVLVPGDNETRYTDERVKLGIQLDKNEFLSFQIFSKETEQPLEIL